MISGCASGAEFQKRLDADVAESLAKTQEQLAEHAAAERKDGEMYRSDLKVCAANEPKAHPGSTFRVLTSRGDTAAIINIPEYLSDRKAKELFLAYCNGQIAHIYGRDPDPVDQWESEMDSEVQSFKDCLRDTRMDPINCEVNLPTPPKISHPG